MDLSQTKFVSLHEGLCVLESRWGQVRRLWKATKLTSRDQVRSRTQATSYQPLTPTRGGTNLENSSSGLGGEVKTVSEVDTADSIHVDAETGRQYSYNAETNKTKWLDEDKEQRMSFRREDAQSRLCEDTVPNQGFRQRH